MAFADALNAEARELEALGADVIQFDEPAFNVFMADVKDWGIAALEKAADKHQHRQARTIDPVKFSLSLGAEKIAAYVPQTSADAAPATREEFRLSWP